LTRLFSTPPVLSLLSGVLYALAFPPFGMGPLIFVALAPLILSGIRDGRFRAVLLYGWIFGITCHLVTFYWVRHTLMEMSGFSPFLGSLGLALFSAYQGLGPALALSVGVLIFRTSPSRIRSWIPPAVWVLVEALYPHIFGLSTGNALGGLTLPEQAADLAGVHGLTFAVVLTNTLLARALLERLPVKVVQASLVLGLLTLYGALRLVQPPPGPIETLRAGFVQPNISREVKLSRDSGTKAAIVREELQSAAILLEEAPDVLVLPEGAFTFFFQDFAADPVSAHEASKSLSREFFRLAADSRTPIILGSLRREGGRLWNTAVVLHGDSSYSIYRKNLLVPFGERVRFRRVLTALGIPVENMSDLAPGKDPGMCRVGGKNAHLSICYEGIFPGFMRRGVSQGDADLLINITDDMWFGRIGAPELHLQSLTLRAVENRIPLLRVASTGITAHVDVHGKVLQRTGLFEKTSGIYEIRLRRMFSLYRASGDIFLCALAACLAWVTLWSLKRAHLT